MYEIYVDPVCPWCWRTAQWFFKEADKNGQTFILKPFSLYRKAVIDGNPPEEKSPVWLKLSRVIAGIFRDFPDDYELQKDTYWQLATNWHEDFVRELPENPKWSNYYDDASLDALLDDHIGEAVAITGSDLGVPIIINRGILPNVGYFGPVIDRVPEGEESRDLYEAFQTLLNIQGVYEIKRIRKS